MDAPADAPLPLRPAAQRRALVLAGLLAGELTTAQAAAVLGCSERQVHRLAAAFRRDGPAALVHGNTGRAPWHALPAAIRQRVVALATGRYAGLNAQHLTEKLADDEHLVLDASTVRKLLKAAGVAGARTRRAPAHRARRERMPRAGLLLQGDGSRHRWLGPDRPYLTLIGFIDDATGEVPAALFRAQEDAAGYLLVLRQIVATLGVPTALYVDRHGIFHKTARRPLTLEEELAGGALPTQVARALEELGVRLILAQSPQAKGRIERLWGTLQDRLVAELRLAGITTQEGANAFLPTFIPAFTARFGVPAAQPEPAYRLLPAATDLERICCFKYERVVRPDNTIVFGTRVLQLRPTPERASWARARVEVDERLDGSLAVYHQERLLTAVAAPPDTPLLRARTGPRSRPGSAAPALATPPPAAPTPGPRKPAPTHPWRRSFLAPPRPTAGA